MERSVVHVELALQADVDRTGCLLDRCGFSPTWPGNLIVPDQLPSNRWAA